jgi:integrase
LGQIKFEKDFLAAGRSKTEGGDGRTIPLNSNLLPVLQEYAEWYKEKCGAIRSEWYVFLRGKPRPSDPTRHVTTLKTSWGSVRNDAKVKGRFHDNRHTSVTELAESDAGDQTKYRLPANLNANANEDVAFATEQTEPQPFVAPVTPFQGSLF